MSDVGARSTASILAELNGRLRGPSLMVWLCAASVWIFILWAAFAWIDEIVRAPGEFISTSRPQIIQNLEGGILAELLVQEGDVVARGDVLARLHDTRFNSEVADLQDQIAGLEVRQLRLEAELAGQFDFTVPDGRNGRLGARAFEGAARGFRQAQRRGQARDAAIRRGKAAVGRIAGEKDRCAD